MEKFKKIYIEITNKCNLKCSFCPDDGLEKKEMTIEEFELILSKITPYTEYVYLHIKGEPLLHSKFSEIVDICKKYNKKINITTNGTLMKLRFDSLKKVRQINISLQSVTNIEKLKEILDVAEELSKQGIYISYRLWAYNMLEAEVLKELETRYGNIENGNDKKLAKNIFINFEKEFIWPDLKNEYINKKGTCYGTRSHIGILVDGTILPCCLDSKGIINLGNIFKENLVQVLKSEKYLKIKKSFEENKLEEELCKKCGFFTN